MRRVVQFMLCAAMAGPGAALAQEREYEVHDSRRPQPAVVTPATPSTQDQPGKAPSDAVVLFDGKDLSKWRSKKDGSDAKWKVENGEIVVAPGTGNIATQEEFADVQLHIEWLQPKGTEGKGQARGNSGVFFMGMYELQVLDSHESETYADGMAGAMYGQYPPLVNAALPQGKWQTYDAVFRAPRYENGKLVEPARATVFFNGVLVQDNVKLLGPTKHKGLADYPDKHPEKGPIELQDHGNPQRFRNIWVRELPKESPPPAVKPAGEHYR